MLAFVLITATMGCNLLGPSESFDGEWTARGPGHSSSFGLVLRQSGERISGVACATESGVLLYSNAPVSGTHPRVSWVVTRASVNPCCPWLAGPTANGEMERRGEIVVHAGITDLRFTRASGPVCPTN